MGVSLGKMLRAASAGFRHAAFLFKRLLRARSYRPAFNTLAVSQDATMKLAGFPLSPAPTVVYSAEWACLRIGKSVSCLEDI